MDFGAYKDFVMVAYLTSHLNAFCVTKCLQPSRVMRELAVNGCDASTSIERLKS